MIKSYASYFTSYLLFNLKDKRNILNVILFGSGARDEAGKESDVDIFINVRRKTKKFENQINKIIDSFYKSREALLFKSKGVDNKINVLVGELDNFKELKKSIESTGVILYGKYISSGVKIKGRKYSVFFWDNIGKNRGAFLNKIYGFNSGGKKYVGMIEVLGGKKIGKSSMMIPVENREEIFKLIKKYKVNSKIIDVYY